MKPRRRRNARRVRRDGAGVLARLKAIAWRRILAPAALLVVMAVTVLAVRGVLDRPLQTVSVEGRFQRVSPLDVEQAVRSAVGTHGLVGVDLRRVSLAVQRLPWVDRASVARHWPDGLVVEVEEQVPVARWGETGLVNVRGELFVNDARHIPPELPELVGPEGTQRLLTQRYLAIKDPLEGAGMRLSRVSLDARGAWEFDLENGMALRLGRMHIDERFGRFMGVAARIVGPRAADIAYVDLRYANGFAIGWRNARGSGNGKA